MPENPEIIACSLATEKITYDSGHSYICPVPYQLDQYDDFILLEGSTPIGPLNHNHSQIREKGIGLFSPWKEALFFSSSDGSDPRSNGRNYLLLMRKKQALADIIANFSFPSYDAPSQNAAINAMIKKGIDTNSSILCDSYYFPWFHRCLVRHYGKMPATTLQIGPGGSLGYEILFTLAGVKEANTIDLFPLKTFDLDNFMETLKSLFTVTSCYEGICGPFSHPLAIPPYRTVGDNEYHVGDSTIRHYYPRSFEETGFPDSSIDFLFSSATMEHVRDPRRCIKETARVLKPGGLTAHGIDLRDHRSFDRPLEFLKESVLSWNRTMDDYCRDVPHGFMNRWRAEDFQREFEMTGMEVLECEPILKADDDYLDRELPNFDAKFRSMTRENLATTGVFIVARKKAD